MTTAFLEVPGNMVAETRRRGAAEGMPVGFAIGCGMIVPRVLVGVYEVVSAPIPAPAEYRPILRPEFPWSYFDEPGQLRRTAAEERVAPAWIPRNVGQSVPGHEAHTRGAAEQPGAALSKSPSPNRRRR
jgi:putative exosortase-associated protein (TIGR04073 family)